MKLLAIGHQLTYWLSRNWQLKSPMSSICDCILLVMTVVMR